jgi:hypothetical protein
MNLDRRQFLGWAATGAAGILMPGIVRPKAKVFDMGRSRRPDRPRLEIYANNRRVFVLQSDCGDDEFDGTLIGPGVRRIDATDARQWVEFNMKTGDGQRVRGGIAPEAGMLRAPVTMRVVSGRIKSAREVDTWCGVLFA